MAMFVATSIHSYLKITSILFVFLSVLTGLYVRNCTNETLDFESFVGVGSLKTLLRRLTTLPSTVVVLAVEVRRRTGVARLLRKQDMVIVRGSQMHLILVLRLSIQSNKKCDSWLTGDSLPLERDVT